MAVKTEKELNEAQRAHWLKAVAAIELRNFGYAISLLQGILKQEPQFLTGRQLLRRTEVTRLKAAKKKFFNVSTASVAVMKAQREMKKDAKRAVELIEKILEDEPYNKQANLALKDAAVAAGWLETGVFALQTLLEENTRDTKLLHELARLYHELGESEREVEIYNRISAIDPADAAAMRLGKDASARDSMKSGGWGAAASYRDLIKDKEAAVSLEQQNRMQLTGESLGQQIAETYAMHEAEPQNVDVARRLGALSEQKDDLDAAIAWYRYASDLTHGSDPGLIRKISDLGVKQTEREIAALEESIANSAGDTMVLAEKNSALAAAKKRRAEMLIEEAMNALGRCYRELGMFDLAAKQLEEAAREIATMDATKKEIVYNLGLVYERMGNREKSLGCMKQIYEADYGYKDVATRVESSYAAGS